MSDTKRKPPTMADVARLAGVSTMTVSRALRADGPASEETRLRIREAAEELGYVLDSTAAGLSSRRTGFVAMTIPSINNSNFADTARGVTEGLRGSGLELLLGYTDYNVEEEERLVEAFLRRRPEAILLTGSTHTERCRNLLRAAAIPVVETWDQPADPLGHVVGFSNFEAGRMMARHLYDRGYRRIGFIGAATERDTRGAVRRHGFVAGLRELGLETDRVWVSGIPPISMREGAVAIDELLRNKPDTDAVMCVSDLSAFGAMMACLRRGLRVPKDIAIAGFGAYDVSEAAVPRITTLDVHAREIGRRAAALVRELLDSGATEAAPTSVEVPITLLPRESTG